MNSAPPSFLSRMRRRLRARLARPQTLFLTPEGLLARPGGKAEAWADWCRKQNGSAVRLLLSSRLLHELVCQPGLPLADEAQLLAYARQQFGQYFGAAAKAWSLASWRLAAEPGRVEQCGALALHGPAAQGWREVAAEHEVRLLQVQPAWAAALQRLVGEEPEWAAAEQAALVWLEGAVVTWLSLTAGRLSGLRQLRLQEASVETLAELLQEQLALQPGLAAAQVRVAGYGLQVAVASVKLGPAIHVHGRLDAPEPDLAALEPVSAKPMPGLPRPDFLGAPRLRSPLAWPLAATSLLVLATAGWTAWEAQQERAQGQQQLADLQARLRAKPAPARAPATLPALAAQAGGRDSARKLEAERLRAAAEVQALLRQPWESLLVQVEQAGAAMQPAPLAWLALDLNSARQELRLEGLAADKLAPLQLVDRLAAQGGFRSVILSRLQNAEQGLSGQRFELNAKLQPELLRPPGGAMAEARP
ncbi:hypothetical protein LNV23_02860 [Paucibacter sp. DJ1R-11]|uniref:hypothetical protein n=1 Tax=Paucibacter sp. DJ1R-11 TaxID=2893556 RepID=UPI0021E3B2A9|nr:hypothetical protein [Paucibacter sp. DJ1R-11]MCV2362387.1 hypothetical protein [Paucibacter sp. DJ1R-11]